MKYKFALLLMLFLVFHLSSTSSLKVIEPSTWSNQTRYNHQADLKDVFDTSSRFYDGYFPTRDGIFYAGKNFYAHKLSHVTAYSILAFLFVLNLKKYRLRRTYSLFFVFIVAFFDECNQYLIIGRTGLFWDVVMDTIAAAVVLFFSYILSKKKIKKMASRVN